MMTDNEINEAVARKLGWVLGLQFWNHKDKGYLLRNPPPYATDIGAAWEIVETMNSSWNVVSVVCEVNVFFVKLTNMGEVWNGPLADTAPRAICEAFLKLP